MNEVQVRILDRAGRRYAQYRSRLACGKWSRTWFSLSVADAAAALKTGRLSVGLAANARVCPWPE